MRVFFVRHGESEANVQRIFSNRKDAHPLTEQGRLQIARLAPELRRRGIVAIYCSPVMRAAQAAAVLSTEIGIPYEVEPGLAEYDVGTLEGQSYAEGRDIVDDLERRWAAGDRDACLPEGESWNQVHTRFSRMLAGVLERFRHLDEAGVLLVGHGGTFCEMLPFVLANVDRTFATTRGLGYASIVEAELRGTALHCVRWDREMLPFDAPGHEG